MLQLSLPLFEMESLDALESAAFHFLCGYTIVSKGKVIVGAGGVQSRTHCLFLVGLDGDLHCCDKPLCNRLGGWTLFEKIITGLVAVLVVVVIGCGIVAWKAKRGQNVESG